MRTQVLRQRVLDAWSQAAPLAAVVDALGDWIEARVIATLSRQDPAAIPVHSDVCSDLVDSAELEK